MPMMTVTQCAEFMGEDFVFEFECEVFDFGSASDPWGDDPGAGPDFQVESCCMYRDMPRQEVPAMEVTGEMLSLVEKIFYEKNAKDIVDNAAEEYWTNKWSGHDY
jgi:hypothetical protein